MKKTNFLLFAVCVFVLAGCGPKIQVNGNIELLVPSGYTLEQTDGSVLKADDYLILRKNKDEFITVTTNCGWRYIRNSIGYSGTAPIEPFTVNDVKWTGRVGMVTATIDGVAWLVSTSKSLYEGFPNEEVRAVLGSLKLNRKQ